MSSTAAAELPSLFAAVQQPLANPRIDLHARQLSSADRKQLDHLVQVAERGPAAHFLHSVLDQSYRQTIHSWSRSRTRTRTDRDDDDDDDLELRERGYVHKPRRSKRRRSRRSHSVAASAEGDDEGDGDETELEATTTHTRSRRDKVQRTRRRVKKLKQSLRIPEIDLERPDLPPDFPPSELFTALHARTSHLYEARHNLLAPLTLTPTPTTTTTTTSSATLPEPVRAHFDALRTRLNAEEERAVRGGTRDVVAAWKRTRIQKANAGERRAIWTDASRAYEGSALVALGLLTQLLVKDAVSTEADLLPDLPPPTGE